MDESEVLKFENPAKVLKLSEAIRIGCQMSSPTKDIDVIAWTTYRDERCFACVIGAAWLGSGRPDKVIEMICGKEQIGSAWVAKNWGIPLEHAVRIQNDYEHRVHTREEIADTLERQGY